MAAAKAFFRSAKATTGFRLNRQNHVVNTFASIFSTKQPTFGTPFGRGIAAQEPVRFLRAGDLPISCLSRRSRGRCSHRSAASAR
jgi:hypothetical protein